MPRSKPAPARRQKPVDLPPSLFALALMVEGPQDLSTSHIRTRLADALVSADTVLRRLLVAGDGDLVTNHGVDRVLRRVAQRREYKDLQTAGVVAAASDAFALGMAVAYRFFMGGRR